MRPRGASAMSATMPSIGTLWWRPGYRFTLCSMEFRGCDFFSQIEHSGLEKQAVDVLMVWPGGWTRCLGDRYAIELRIGGLVMRQRMESDPSDRRRTCGNQSCRSGVLPYRMAAVRR